MEQNQATTQATAKGINQWNKIIAGDASDLTEEERENLHMALDIMSTLPGGGVYDWLNAELYAAEGNTKMAAACTVAVALPGVIPATKYLVDKAIDFYNLSKSADLMNLALKAGSIDELAEGMIKYGDELQEAGEELAKQAVESARKIIPNIGFDDFGSLKKHIGNPGDGNAWHHIVEQSQIGKRANFDASQVHNVNNIIAIPAGTDSIHSKISAHYSSKFDFKDGLTVRDWLATKSFDEQI